MNGTGTELLLTYPEPRYLRGFWLPQMPVRSTIYLYEACFLSSLGDDGSNGVFVASDRAGPAGGE